MSAAALTSTTRSALGALVEREASRVGQMRAYENVARDIRVSASWVRKFLAESHEVKEPRITLFQNIRASYEELCNRVELDNRADELRLKLIKGELDAVTEGFVTEGVRENSALVGTHEAEMKSVSAPQRVRINT